MSCRILFYQMSGLRYRPVLILQHSNHLLSAISGVCIEESNLVVWDSQKLEWVKDSASMYRATTLCNTEIYLNVCPFSFIYFMSYLLSNHWTAVPSNSCHSSSPINQPFSAISDKDCWTVASKTPNTSVSYCILRLYRFFFFLVKCRRVSGGMHNSIVSQNLISIELSVK